MCYSLVFTVVFYIQVNIFTAFLAALKHTVLCAHTRHLIGGVCVVEGLFSRADLAIWTDPKACSECIGRKILLSLETSGCEKSVADVK